MIGYMVTSIKFNKQQKSVRRNSYDVGYQMRKSGYGGLRDRTKLRTFEFASLQKEILRERRRTERSRRWLLFIFSVLFLSLLVYVLFLVQ